MNRGKFHLSLNRYQRRDPKDKMGHAPFTVTNGKECWTAPTREKSRKLRDWLNQQEA